MNPTYALDIRHPCRGCGANEGEPCRANKTLTPKQVELGYVHFGRRLKRLLAEVPTRRGVPDGLVFTVGDASETDEVRLTASRAKKRRRRPRPAEFFLGYSVLSPEEIWHKLCRLEQLMTFPARCNCWCATERGSWALGMRAAFSGAL